MEDNYFGIQTDKLYKRIGFFILFAIAINLLLFYGCSYLENEITKRTFINTYLIYCAFLALFHTCVYKKTIRNFVKMTFGIIFIGLLAALSYILLLVVGYLAEILAYLMILIVYVFFQLATLKLCFKIKPIASISFVTILIFLAGFKAISLMQDYTNHYYGFSFVCSVWSFNIILSVLLYSDTIFDKNSENTALDKNDTEEINIEKFETYLNETFKSQITYYEIFKEFHLFDIDCFPENYKYKLTIEISTENIKFSTITKEPSVDFSSYDYVIETNKEAEDFVQHIIKFGWPKDLD